MAKIALCIPTYKRSECVKEFLQEYAPYYTELGIDIYYYDSSPDTKTQEIVLGYAQKEERIHYIKMPEELHSNAKVYKIFQQYGLEKKYDFLWVCNDAIRWAENALAGIIEQVDSKYDIIEPDYDDVEQLGQKEYSDYNEYLRDCAWKLTLYGAAMVNIDTILSNVDWKRYEEEFLQREVINFSHVSLYFYRIAEMKSFRALYIPVDNTYFKSSVLKKSPGWHNDTLFIFCESWINTIERLPDCYTEKKEAILKHGVYTVFKNKELMVKLRKEGILTLRSFWKYKNEWRKVCMIPYWSIFSIAVIPVWVYKRKDKKRKNKILNRFKRFCKRHPRFIIYGAGNMGYIVGSYCNKMQILYDGFCVSKIDKGSREYLNHPVWEFSEVATDLQGKGILVCMRGDFAEEVISLLKHYQLEEHIYYDMELFEVIGYELDYKT